METPKEIINASECWEKLKNITNAFVNVVAIEEIYLDGSFTTN